MPSVTRFCYTPVHEEMTPYSNNSLVQDLVNPVLKGKAIKHPHFNIRIVSRLYFLTNIKRPLREKGKMSSEYYQKLVLEGILLMVRNQEMTCMSSMYCHVHMASVCKDDILPVFLSLHILYIFWYHRKSTTQSFAARDRKTAMKRSVRFPLENTTLNA
jgi:hypothetical protein